MYNVDLLANAIIEQACKDYYKVKIKLLSNDCDIKRLTINEQQIYNDRVLFFKSDWFIEISPDIDGPALMAMLDKKAKYDLEKRKPKK